ncbi:hypothetical protein L195_g042049 [Trifolium pratense]|uniref:Uncharacterized protein n=1 Tax=Trifolium pratense TaxID=57577 RepID=A0A2K3M5C2_TRIPR|nr:hypothetical protein L195_g042049 [Trifolium pratense]
MLMVSPVSKTVYYLTMSMPPESVFSGSRGMPPESVFPGRIFHHPDHRSFWQRLQIWERVIIIIFAVVFIGAMFYRVIYPRIIQLWQWWHSPQAQPLPVPAMIELQPPPV